MKDEIPDRMIDDGAWNAPAAASAVRNAYGESGEEYLLNDIGVALRLLSERG